MKITCQVMIGKVIIEPSERDGMVWLFWSDDGVNNSGEGQEVLEESLARMLEQFYKDSF